jgi:hypothetical protein
MINGRGAAYVEGRKVGSGDFRWKYFFLENDQVGKFVKRGGVRMLWM